MGEDSHFFKGRDGLDDATPVLDSLFGPEDQREVVVRVTQLAF